MKVVIACDSFKGSCGTLQVANAVESGIIKVLPDAEVIKFPISDGGEGTVEAMVLGAGGEFKTKYVTGPLGEKVKARYGIINGNIAVIEMAEASGLTLVPAEKRNPLMTTTFGTGELIKAALDEGCKKIIIGIGGSATNDGGIGMAQALGVSFKDEYGCELGFGGGELNKLCRVDISNIDLRLKETEIIAACDVSNPLCGEKGASAVYGPQKGATQQMVKQLDVNLSHYANLIKAQLGKDVIDVPGAGAAGGLGAALMVFCEANLRPGIETILSTINIEEHLKQADLVITGEGRIDNQSIYGKAPVGVAQLAKKYKVPVLAVAGSIGEEAAAVYDFGIDSIINIVNNPMTLEKAMKEAEALIEDAIERAMRTINIGRLIKW